MPNFSWPEIHGALTHFPVALLITAVVFDLGAALFRRPNGHVVSFWLLVAAVVMAVPTLYAGWMAGDVLFHDVQPPNIFVWHRTAAFTTAGIAAVLLLFRALKRDLLLGGARALSILLLLAAAGTVGYTGYLGGRMLFGSQAVSHEHGGGEEHEGKGHEHGGGEHHEDKGHEQHATEEPEAPDPKLVAAGEQAFKARNCLSCHKMSGKGGTLGPELTNEGTHQPDMNWQVEHLKNPAKMTPGSSMPSFAHLKPDELNALAAYLISRR